MLMLVGDQDGCCCIYDPAHEYKLIFKSVTYDEANSWLLEDEYERVDGRFLEEEVP
jgi:hypothetical protein